MLIFTTYKTLSPHEYYQTTFIKCCIKTFLQVIGQNKLQFGNENLLREFNELSILISW